MGIKWRPARTPHGQQRVPSVEFERARFLYEELGLSVYEVGEVIGRTYKPTYERLRRAGVTFRTPGEAKRLRHRRRPYGKGVPLDVKLAA